MDCSCFVLGGGGLRGIAQLGYMHEQPVVQRYVGISVGAILGFCLKLGYPASLLFQLITRIYPHLLPTDIQPEAYSLLSDRTLKCILGRLGAARGVDIEAAYVPGTCPVESVTYCLTCRETLWLRTRDIYNLSRQSIDTVHQRSWFSIWDTIRCSMSVPMGFPAVQRDTHVFLDGMTSVYSPFLIAELLTVLQQDEQVIYVPTVSNLSVSSFPERVLWSQWIHPDDTEAQRLIPYSVRVHLLRCPAMNSLDSSNTSVSPTELYELGRAVAKASTPSSSPNTQSV